jgi:vanillate monooxygenase ferredoxin subunit
LLACKLLNDWERTGQHHGVPPYPKGDESLNNTTSKTSDHSLTVLVSRRSAEAEGIISLALTSTGGGSLPPFSPGAHIDVHLPAGHVRQYSLHGDSLNNDRYEIAILKEENSRGGSRSAHDDLREGTHLQISTPRNHFPLHVAPHSVLLAGGIGITPLLCMARYLHAKSASFELHYCVRTAKRAAFRTWLEQGEFASRTHFHFDDGPAEQRFDAATILKTASANTHLYVCGPTGFMDHALTTAKNLAWADARLHHEYFSARVQEKQLSNGFQVECARAGMVVDVLPEQSIASALRSHGIEVPLSCEQGICGTCSVTVLDGVPDHRDHFLSAAERAANDRLLACCSRAVSPRLVIDL